MAAPANTVSNDCLERLIALKAASRLGQGDTSLFDAHPGDAELAGHWLGWTHLSSRPPWSPAKIAAVANEVLAEGLEAVVLIGQGGSSQASMTITKLHEVSRQRAQRAQGLFNTDSANSTFPAASEVAFRTMDSLSPVFVHHILGSSDPARTLYIVSSKSGSTIEPMMLERGAWRYAQAHLGREACGRRFVAITDPGSGLELLAREKGYRDVLSTPVDVGGRFSALTAFCLLPAALVGLDIQAIVAQTAQVEAACCLDNADNPALQLAAFLGNGLAAGRDKFSLVMPPAGQVFGLWVEQLVAESLGKQGQGILPNVEVDASILAVPRADRCAITYKVGEVEGFAESIAHIDPSIPTLHLSISTPAEAFSQFVIWEYAVAFLGVLMGVFPFDQPDVEVTKQLVRDLLLAPAGSPANTALAGSSSGDAQPRPAGQAFCLLRVDNDIVRALRASQALTAPDMATGSLDAILRQLLGSLACGDYFCLNAFLPFRGFGRREALERMRNRVASRLGVVSCLEIGPRYLHSTGQLHKGGPNTGVFLLLSADEDDDIAIPYADYTLGHLAATQALGDFTALASLGRRALHVHLRDNDSETLSRFADHLCAAISACKRPL